MIALIFATSLEARPFLVLSQAVRQTSEPFRVYQTPLQPQLHIVISGIGKVAAAAACQSMILTYRSQQIINAGACGLLQDLPGVGVGHLVRVTTAQEGDHEVFGKRPVPVNCGMCLSPQLPPARLVTGDRPVFDQRRRRAYAKLGDVVDMEGAAIARVCDLYGVPRELIKGISDTAEPMKHKLLLQNLNSVSESIAGFLWRAMSDCGPPSYLDAMGTRTS